MNMKLFLNKSVLLNAVCFQNSLVIIWKSLEISVISLDFVDITCQHLIFNLVAAYYNNETPF
jgi:hypothetical protein